LEDAGVIDGHPNAAERTGRHARAIELDPRFVDVAIQRWQRFTRESAIHSETGKAFGEDRSDG
jgi:DNA modification methylase